MGLHADFPRDPHAILSPGVRWYPGEENLRELKAQGLIPPLVQRIREEVAKWREEGYPGVSDTSRSLLRWWFIHEHWSHGGGIDARRFQYYYGQREAVESAIWLYEVARVHDSAQLVQFDSSGLMSMNHFGERWPRYVMKLATGAGKTKVMSLLIAWSYFHHLYEPDSTLANNILLIAPNIIVLDRLRSDFDGLRIFNADPVLPEDGHGGRDWRTDFQMTLHIQDDVHGVSDLGNLFLTNIHRVYEPRKTDADDLMASLFDLNKPGATLHTGQVDLGEVVKRVPNLLVLNDEAHHVHDEDMAWSKAIQRLHFQLQQKGTRLAAQLDLTATPRHQNGGIFPHVISDYPLVEAIAQGVVKTPVIPDEPSRAKLREQDSETYVEQYEDYLQLGYLEWKKAFDELAPTGKKAILFVMTDDTKHCDQVGAYLETLPEFAGRVLVIHTKANGEISESASGKDKEELARLRQQSRDIDLPESPYRAIVSVMVLREGWDVQNVTTIVGLRAYKAKSKILPEQTLGRGLRRMFRGQPELQEKVSVIGTEAFMNFVEEIKHEGVPLEEVAMGGRTRPQTPLLVEVDQEDKDPAHEIEVPLLSPRVAREFKDLSELDPATLEYTRQPVRHYTEEQLRDITFREVIHGDHSHVQTMVSGFSPSIQSAIGFFTQMIAKDLHLVGGFDILYGKLKTFIADGLFESPVDLDDPQLLRNLSEPAVRRVLIETIKDGINRLTIKERGEVQVRDMIRMSKTRPFLANDTTHVLEHPKKSLLTRVIGDSHFEIELAAFLDDCPDLLSYIKTSQNTDYRLEYQNVDGSISYYYPDFIVKENFNHFTVIEAKGQEDQNVSRKWRRLEQWCADATKAMQDRFYSPLYVRYEVFQEHRPRTFKELKRLCGDDQPANM